ncbi:transmembrane protein, putative [Medicago truncatula]|uniref:Transmembrane protein, putative n=1 Tax=Medicago truncatula TaxID=3880 RepID=A0A072VI37_MEDTR|nr:transmembrane protein, putative [Medicago truncatula]
MRKIMSQFLKIMSPLNTRKNMLPAKRIVTRFTNRVDTGLGNQINGFSFVIKRWKARFLSNVQPIQPGKGITYVDLVKKVQKLCLLLVILMSLYIHALILNC